MVDVGRPEFPSGWFEPVFTKLLASLSYQELRNPDIRPRALLLTGKKGVGKKSVVRSISTKVGLSLVELNLQDLEEIPNLRIKAFKKSDLVLLKSGNNDENLNNDNVARVVELIKKKLIKNDITCVLVTTVIDIPYVLEKEFDLVLNLNPQYSEEILPKVLEYVFYPNIIPKNISKCVHRGLSKLKWAQFFSVASSAFHDLLHTLQPQNFEELLLGANICNIQAEFWDSVSRNVPISDGGFLLNHPDIVGLDEQKEILERELSALIDENNYMALPRKSGILLYGPPGTGKTFVVKKLLQQKAVKMIIISPADWVHAEVGASQKAVHSTFVKAREHTPSVIFIDEIEALFGISNYRTALDEYGYTSSSIIYQLCQEFDDLDSGTDRILLLAATNYLEGVPRILFGFNRIELLVKFHTLSIPNFVHILKELKMKKIIHTSVDTEEIAQALVDMTVSDLYTVIRYASSQSIVESNCPPSDVHIYSALNLFKKNNVVRPNSGNQ